MTFICSAVQTLEQSHCLTYDKLCSLRQLPVQTVIFQPKNTISIVHYTELSLLSKSNTT